MIGPQLTHNAKASGLIKYWLARLWFWITGWDVVGEVPKDSSFILVGAHHTSNWDFIYSLTAAFIFRVKISWMGKHTLFKRPYGFVMRALGGIPVDRTSPHGVVSQMANQLRNADSLVVMIAPDGTRKKMQHWKSGFYWIAREAQVPVVCAFLDYERKQAGIGLSILPGDDVEADMDEIRAFYKDVAAKFPEKMTPVRLRKEKE